MKAATMCKFSKQELVGIKVQKNSVFCGSSQGKKSNYQDAAIELGKELVLRNIDLVYGGGSIGLMGLVAQAVHEGGGHVIGVIPKTLMPRELIGEIVGEVKAVADMHQRKSEMAKHSDAFIALPGKKLECSLAKAQVGQTPFRGSSSSQKAAILPSHPPCIGLVHMVLWV